MEERDFLTSPHKEPPDLEERDYYMINAHLEVEFEDIFAEPDSIHTFDCLWNSSFNCFTFCQNFCYKLSTLCCSFCAVLHITWQLASAFFCVIWCATPCHRATQLHLRCPKRLCQECVECCLKPCCEDVSRHLEVATKS